MVQYEASPLGHPASELPLGWAETVLPALQQKCGMAPLLVEKTILFSMNWFCAFFQKSGVSTCVGLFLGFLFCSIDLDICSFISSTLS